MDFSKATIEEMRRLLSLNVKKRKNGHDMMGAYNPFMQWLAERVDDETGIWQSATSFHTGATIYRVVCDHCRIFVIVYDSHIPEGMSALYVEGEEIAMFDGAQGENESWPAYLFDGVA